MSEEQRNADHQDQHAKLVEPAPADDRLPFLAGELLAKATRKRAGARNHRRERLIGALIGLERRGRNRRRLGPCRWRRLPSRHFHVRCLGYSVGANVGISARRLVPEPASSAGIRREMATLRAGRVVPPIAELMTLPSSPVLRASPTWMPTFAQTDTDIEKTTKCDDQRNGHGNQQQ